MPTDFTYLPPAALHISYHQDTQYQETLSRLAKPPRWGTGLMVKQDGEICQVGLLRLFIEKIKGLFEGKLGINRCQSEWVASHVIYFLEIGAQNQWLKSESLPLIQSLAQRAGLSSTSQTHQDQAAKNLQARLQIVVDTLAQKILSSDCQEQTTSPSACLSEQPKSVSKLEQPEELTPLQLAVDKTWLNVQEARFQELWSDPTQHQTLFHQAIEDGDISFVKRALIEKVSLDEEDEREETPLMVAALYKRSEIFELLLNAGADLCKPNNNGLNALFAALLVGDAEIAKMSVEQASDLQSVFQQATPLHAAVQSGHVEAVKILLARGADIHAKDEYGLTALHRAAKYKQTEITQLLIKAGADLHQLDLNGNTPLHAAVESGHVEALPFLMQSKEDMYQPDFKGVSPLGLSASLGHKKIIKWFLKNGAAIEHANVQGSKLIQLAANQDRSEVVTYLLTQGAEFDNMLFQELPPIEWAIEKGQVKALKFLLPRGLTLPTLVKKEPPLRRAILNGHLAMTKLLLEHGVDVHEANTSSETPLYLAVSGGHTEIVKLLLDVGADVNKADVGWRTPLHLAASKGQTEIVKLLLAAGAGADVNKTDVGWRTPLYLAASKGHTEIVKLLLDVGADVNKTDIFWDTPLHLAASGGHTEIVKLLLDAGAGADVNKTDVGWRTPLYLAASKGHTEIVKLLVDAGANQEALSFFLSWNGLKWYSPLQLAALVGHTEITKFLLEKQTGNLDQEVMSACFYRSPEDVEIMKLLLEKGLDIHITADGLSPLVIAKIANYKKIAAQIIAKDSQTLPYAKEVLWRKTIAHVTEQQGNSYLTTPKSKPSSLRLMGMTIGDYFWKKIAKRSATFAKECDTMPAKLAQVLAETAQFAADGHSQEETLERWKAGKPIFLNSGFKGHHIGVMLWKNRLVFSNLNGNSANDQHAYLLACTFDEACLTKEILDQITDITPNRETKIDFFCKLIDLLKGRKSSLGEALASIPLPAQKVGNCVWHNSAGLVFPLCVMQAIEDKRLDGPVSNEAVKEIIQEQKLIFEQWNSYQRAYALQKYLKVNEKGEHPYQPDFSLVGRAFADSYPYQNKDALDSKLAQKWQQTKELFCHLVPKWHQRHFYAVAAKKSFVSRFL